jgi:hypothetical protein
MSSHDLAYYQERLKAELALVKAAQNDVAAAVHQALAREYQKRIDEFEERPALRIAWPK